MTKIHNKHNKNTIKRNIAGRFNGEWFITVVMASKLYGVNATIIIFVFVLYCNGMNGG